MQSTLPIWLWALSAAVYTGHVLVLWFTQRRGWSAWARYASGVAAAVVSLSVTYTHGWAAGSWWLMAAVFVAVFMSVDPDVRAVVGKRSPHGDSSAGRR